MPTEAVPAFSYKGWDLGDAVDALSAYDLGCADSGVRDDAMKIAVRDYLRSLPEDERVKACARIARDYLSDEMIDQGYGLGEVKELIEWFEQLGVNVDR
jgi:hypothetical protein